METYHQKREAQREEIIYTSEYSNISSISVRNKMFIYKYKNKLVIHYSFSISYVFLSVKKIETTLLTTNITTKRICNKNVKEIGI